MTITPEGRIALDALKANVELTQWLLSIGFPVEQFSERDWARTQERYLLLQTKAGTEHCRFQEAMDARKANRQYGGVASNTVDRVEIGDACVLFFPRQGEIQIRPRWR